MPHESTVAHEQRFVMESPMISRSRAFSVTDDDSSENCANHHHVSIHTVSIWLYYSVLEMQNMERRVCSYYRIQIISTCILCDPSIPH